MKLDWVDKLVPGVDVNMSTPIYKLELSERTLLEMLEGREFYVNFGVLAVIAIRKERDNG